MRFASNCIFLVLPCSAMCARTNRRRDNIGRLFYLSELSKNSLIEFKHLQFREDKRRRNRCTEAKDRFSTRFLLLCSTNDNFHYLKLSFFLGLFPRCLLGRRFL